MMKGILVFNQLNDVVFIQHDDAFKTYVNQQASNVGLMESGVTGHIDPNVVLQLFSPLIASQRFMIAHLRNPYHSITCDNGMIFVFEQFHDQIHVAINGDGDETAEYLHRKLLVLQRLLSFLFGPVHEEICPDKASDRAPRWNFVSQLLDTWTELRLEEQSFLIEAVERLHVNQVLNAKCIELLESTLTTMKMTGERNVVHAMLVVNAKLLALYSSRNAYELQASDILLMVLLTKALFPNKQTLEDLFSRSYIASVDVSRSGPLNIKPSTEGHFESASEGQEDDSDEIEYFSTPSSPRVSPKFSTEYKTPETKDLEEGGGVVDTDAYFTPKSHNDPARESQQSTQSSSESIKRSSSASTQDSGREKDWYHKQSVQLGTPTCKHSPHILHCIQVLPGTTLILVAEVPRGRQVYAICKVLSAVRAVLSQGGREIGHGRFITDLIDTNMKKIHDLIKKLKGASVSLERLYIDIVNKWDRAKKENLAGYLDSKTIADDLPPRLDSCLSYIHEKLKELFRLLYLVPWKQPAELTQNIYNGIERVQHTIQCHLWDYKDYLAVKAQRNIAMTSFVEEFPGLVHFIYVDRTTHHMWAPSINVTTEMEDAHMNLMMKVKHKICSLVPNIQSQLRDGYLWQSVRDGDLLFSYFLWFEDTSGNPVPLQYPFPGCSHNILPGILAGSFYRQLIKQCVATQQQRNIHCYELVTVHMSLVPSQFVLKHCQKLASILWEATGEANSPISLL